MVVQKEEIILFSEDQLIPVTVVLNINQYFMNNLSPIMQIFFKLLVLQINLSKKLELELDLKMKSHQHVSQIKNLKIMAHAQIVRVEKYRQ